MLKEVRVDAFNTSSVVSNLVGEPSSRLRHSQSQIVLSGQIDTRWRLRQPILLDVEITDQGDFIVSNDTLESYGVGETPQEAIEEFSSMLLDLYRELVNSEENLSLHYRQILQRLRSYLIAE